MFIFLMCETITNKLYKTIEVWMQSVGDAHKKEIEVVQKKLKWYAENQQLLDKDAALLKQKDAEIAQLSDKLQQLRTDVSCFR